MAAYLNRTLSMVTGNGSYDTNAITDPGSSSPPSRLHAHEISPLQIFVRAKKKVNDIFVEIEEYITETTQFIDGKFIYRLEK